MEEETKERLLLIQPKSNKLVDEVSYKHSQSNNKMIGGGIKRHNIVVGIEIITDYGAFA